MSRLGRGLRAAPAMQTASGQGRGLGYKSLSPLAQAGVGGLKGLSQLLMALGSGQPEQAGQAFSAGVQQSDAQQQNRSDRARQDEIYGLELEDRDLARQDRLDDKSAAAQAKRDRDAAIDALPIDDDMKAALKTEVVNYGDVKPAADEWEIKTVREGNQDVTYWVNKKTREKQQIGAGSAFKPGSDGNSLSINSPVWGLDKDGNTVLLQMSSDGTARQTILPPGVTPVRPNVSVDTGTGTAMVSPVTGQATSVIPKDIAGKESAEVQGAAQGQAIVDLPGALAKADEARKQIAKLKEHPGRTYATGKSSVLPIVPGTSSQDFDVLLNQAKGGVFLQAYTQLKGGGAITQIEGEKAEQAIARMDRAQTESEFLAALDEYDAVIAAGMNRLKQRAGKGGTPYAQGGGTVPPPPSGFVVMQ
jgi:hypothetical protein